MPARSYLFVPANRPERFDKALASGADAVVLDLEDAVADEAKPAARQALADWLRAVDDATRARVVVRPNDAASPHFTEDLRLLSMLAPAALMPPKAEDPTVLSRLHDSLPAARLLPLIETALGLARCDALAAAPAVERLVFGTLDLALDLDLDISDDPSPLAEAAARLVLASRLAQRAAPVAGVTPQLDDEARLRTDLDWSRRRGFGAKLCIHPRQVATVHAGLAPDADTLDWARRVLAAESASPGAARLDGRMIDRPVVLQAQRLLARAGR